MKNPLVELVEENKEKFFTLFNQYGGRLSFEERQGEKGDYLEVKVLNESAQLAGIIWFFGPRRAYIEDIRLMVTRKENQKIDMVLLAGEGTTSAGKKELKEAKIRLIKDLDLLKALPQKKKRKSAKKIKIKEVSVDDDVTLMDIPDSPLIKLAQNLIQEREPEIIRVKEIKGAEHLTFEIRGYTSNNEELAVYRTVDHKNIGVKTVRQFSTSLDVNDTVPVALIAPDKFTPSAKKEASELSINLISQRQEIETKGTEEQQVRVERLRSGALDIIGQSKFKIVKKTSPKFAKLIAGSESLGTYIIAQNAKKDFLLVLLPFEEVVRVATVREFKNQMESLDVLKGMLIPLKRFTYTAEREAKDGSIRAFPKTHPVFNIFAHDLVPIHELMTKDEIDEMLSEHNANLKQLPRIYETDAAVLLVDGTVGDVIKIVRGGGNFNYRLVIPRKDGGVTETTALFDLSSERDERLRKTKSQKKAKKKLKVKA